MKYLIFCLFSMTFIDSTFAHQPDRSSTMVIEQADGTWLLQIKSAMTAFEYEVHQTFGEKSYSTAEEFNALVIKHLQNNIIIDFNTDGTAQLSNGMVKLGHETTVLFKVEGMPKQLNHLTLTNSSFKDIHHNQSALVIVKEGFEKQQFVLNNQNHHTAALQVGTNKFEPVVVAKN